MKVIFSSYAKQELDDATHYYEFELRGPGKLFRTEVSQAAKRIAVYPQSWSIEKMRSGNVFYISFLTNCFTRLKRTMFLSWLLLISIESPIIG